MLALLGTGIATMVLVGFLVMQPKPTPRTTQPSPVVAQAVTAPITNRGLPIRLKIPRLGVDAAVAYMGLTKAGDMDTPTSIKDVAWYKYGPLPGNTGSAVMSGHITGPKGVPAVFSQLSKLQIGDQFSVVDSTTQTTTFAVRAVHTYDQDAQPAEVFTSNEGAHLNLITCTGDWDKTQRRFMKRLVVFSDKSQ